MQQAARQAAVWRYTDGWELDQADATLYNSVYDNAVRNAYNAILAAVPASPPVEYQPGNVQIVIEPASSTGFLPYQPTHTFKVRLTKGAYPLAGYTVTVATTAGTLNRTSAVTDAAGEATFTVTSTSAATATLTASAVLDLPAGSRFIDQASPDAWQRLVLGQVIRVPVQAQARHTWEQSSNLIIAHKFEDRNFNGVQEEDEANLAGWTFTLTTPAGSTTATTDAQGNAFFSGLIADYGTYAVAETLQTGWTNSTPASQSRQRSAADPWTQWRANFGNGHYSVLDILKYLDNDGDQMWDEGQEPPLPGWQFALYIWRNGDWAQHRGGTTGADGRLIFTDLIAGEYRLVEQAANHPGYVNTTPLIQDVTLGYPVRREVRFGNRGALSLSGSKYSDLDADGSRDAGEPGLAGWTIRLRGGPRDITLTTTTGAEGRYRFDNLEPGAYILTEDGQTGWGQTAPGGAGSHAVTLTDRNAGDLDFGNTQLACLGDYVWLDQNRNGIQDRDEAGVPGVTVELFKQIGGAWVSQGTQRTNADGLYAWCDLRAGSYYVRFTAPAGYSITRRDQGGDDTRDSDADPDTGTTIPITIRAGDNQPQWDAGLFQPPAIDLEKYVSVDGQQTWHDADAPTGPQAVSGANVYFRFVITNIGNVPLSDVTLSDNVFALTGCPAIPNPLQPAESYTCIYGPTPAQVGQHADTATATGRYSDITVRDTDDAHYTVPTQPAIDVEKSVSADGGATWQNADLSPGPQIRLDDPVHYRFVVVNTGNVPLSNVLLTDSVYALSGCAAIPDPLAPGASYTCLFQTVATDIEGCVHFNTATVTGRYNSTTVRDSDDAYYYAPSRPALDVEKLVSVDGGVSWHDADAAPGPQTMMGQPVHFRFVVVNTGNVALNNVRLTDNRYSLATCGAIPNPFNLGQSTICEIGPLPASAGQHTNRATASGTFSGLTVQDADDANYNALSSNSSIGDLVWRDVDLDGIKDAGEPGIDGVLVELLDATGTIVATEVTNAGGLYLFDGLLAGSYQVRVAASNFDAGRPLAGFAFTSGAYEPNPYPVDLGSDATFLFADFGYARARLTLTKRASATQVLRGGRVTYTYEVVNTGDTWLGGIAVNDDRLGQICAAPAIGPLGPGQRAECSQTTTLAQRTCNIGTATANATTAAGAPLAAAAQATSATVCVEVVAAFQHDYGDAADPAAGVGVGNYQTTAADGGPSHVIVPGLYLGRQAPDGDNGTAQNADADVDDTTGLDDEDGIALLPVITTASGGVNIMVSAVNETGRPATLACWIDLNRDGDFLDAGERTAATVNSATGRQSVNLIFSGFPVPTPGVSYLRCRIASTANEVALPTGPAESGEVEDHWITIINVGQCRASSAAQALPASVAACPEVSISGLTWVDKDRNGVFEEEAVLSQVVLSVKDRLGQRVAWVTTGPDGFAAGRYLIPSLPPDAYFVTVESWPSGFAPLGPQTQKIVLWTSGETSAADFAFERTQQKVYLPTVLRAK